MYKCDICGRELFKKKRNYGYILCSKHMHQYIKYGKFLDDIPRTVTDLNDYVIKDDIVIFNIYNQKNIKTTEFVIDIDDIEKVKYKKWRLSHDHIFTGSGAGNMRDVSHVIMDIPKDKDGEIVIDHIDGNPRNNQKSNLRICTQADNTCNKSFTSNNTSGFIGVSFRRQRDTYDPEIRKGYIRCHLGYQKTLKEAVYARYFAEGVVFGEFCNEEEHLKKFMFTRDLPEEDKVRIMNTVKEKLMAKGLWQ